MGSGSVTSDKVCDLVGEFHFPQRLCRSDQGVSTCVEAHLGSVGSVGSFPVESIYPGKNKRQTLSLEMLGVGVGSGHCGCEVSLFFQLRNLSRLGIHHFSQAI